MRALYTGLLLGVSSLVLVGCAPIIDYSPRDHYPPTEAPSPEPAPGLLSAHLSRFGEDTPPPSEAKKAQMVEPGEHHLDRLLLVFSQRLDPLTVDPGVFGVLRADGHRVRPTRAILAPADERDENRNVTLIGDFGSPSVLPVAVHILGHLYAEGGEDLRGLDALVSGPGVPDHVLLVEPLPAEDGRCPGSSQVLRTYWSDELRDVGLDDLPTIELRLADGQTASPAEFDDHALRNEDPPCEGCPRRPDDNVLDLCLATDAEVVGLHIPAGRFRDANGLETAAATVEIPSTSPTPH